jgi:cell wall-associated NlpC family hydrolase
MSAANGRCPYCLCAIIGAVALGIAPIADAQSARGTWTSTAGHGKAMPPAAEASGTRIAALPARKAWAGAQDVAIYALGLIGIDYRFGGSTPENGLDCSGLVHHVFQHVTGVVLPRTSKEMSGVGSKIRIDELRPGDLVFFNTRRFSFSHVGIYLGDHRFVHAPSPGGEVEIATLSASYWHARFDGARRLVDAPPSPNIPVPLSARSIANAAPVGFVSANYAESTP